MSVLGACVGVAVLRGVGFGDALWVGAGIFAVAKPSGLALAWSSELPTADGAAARVAASSGLAELAVSGVGHHADGDRDAEARQRRGDAGACRQAAAARLLLAMRRMRAIQRIRATGQALQARLPHRSAE